MDTYCCLLTEVYHAPSQDEQLWKTSMKNAFSKVTMATAIMLTTAFGQKAEIKDTTRSTLNVLEMKSVPAGHYYVNFRFDGEDRHLNIKVNDGKAECVNTSDLRLKGLKGEFQLIGNGVFLVSLHNNNHRASQFWLFRPDGTAAVKEVPDRGENQLAQPVASSSIEPPKKTS